MALNGPVKMIVVDLDDTLLQTDKTVSSYTYAVFSHIRKLGIKLVYATARGTSASRMIPNELFDGFVCHNGAKVHWQERLIYQRGIHPESYVSFLKKLSDYGLKVAAEIDEIHYANFDVWEKWDNIGGCVITDYTNIEGVADKLYAFVEAPGQLDLIQSSLPLKTHLKLARDMLAMVMHEEAQKSLGVKALANAMGIGRENILGFGDDLNDIDLLHYCGTSVAMGNALEDVKAAADHIAGTNNEDGIARWLKEHLL